MGRSKMTQLCAKRHFEANHSTIVHIKTNGSQKVTSYNIDLYFKRVKIRLKLD